MANITLVERRTYTLRKSDSGWAMASELLDIPQHISDKHGITVLQADGATHPRYVVGDARCEEFTGLLLGADHIERGQWNTLYYGDPDTGYLVPVKLPFANTHGIVYVILTKGRTVALRRRLLTKEHALAELKAELDEMESELSTKLEHLANIRRAMQSQE